MSESPTRSPLKSPVIPGAPVKPPSSTSAVNLGTAFDAAATNKGGRRRKSRGSKRSKRGGSKSRRRNRKSKRR